MSAAPTIKVTTTDGKAYEAKLIMADYIKFDFLRAKNQWPAKEGNEISYLSACLYCALIRTGQIDNNTNANKFLETIAEFDIVEEDEAEFRAESGA